LNVVHAEGIARVVLRVCVFLVMVCWVLCEERACHGANLKVTYIPFRVALGFFFEWVPSK
jgi:hypothetical protein